MGTRFIIPTEETTIKLRNDKEVVLTKDQYFYADDNKNHIIIKHARLIEIADENNMKVDKTNMEFGCFNSPYNYCFVHRSFGTLPDGTVVDEVGEANPNNLDSNISTGYPAIMSNKRSQDRLLIRLMGLTGKVYSEVEYVEEKAPSQVNSTEAAGNTSSPAPSTKGPGQPTSSQNNQGKNLQKVNGSAANTGNPQANAQATSSSKEMSVEEAGKLMVNFSPYDKTPITLKELMDKDPKYFNWLAVTFKPGPRTEEHMKNLKIGAMILKNQLSAAS